MDWKPIETAPKNKRILVCTGVEIYCANWVCNPYTGDESWLVAEFYDGEQVLVKATHWAELPDYEFNEPQKDKE